MTEVKLKSAPSQPRGRWLKWVGGVLGGLILLVVVAYFVVTSGGFVKRIVLPKVGAALNADLTAAEIELSPFSQLVLRDVKLTPKGRDTLLTAQLLRARYSLMAILRGNLAVSELTVESPNFTVIENADGTSNLDPLMQGGKSETAKPTATPATAPKLDIKTIALKNAIVKQTQHLKGGGRQVMELAGLNLTVADLKNGASGRLEISADIAFENSSTNAANLAGKLSGNFGFDLTADLKPARFNGKANFAVEKAGGAFADFGALMATLEAEASPTEIKQLALRFTQSGQPLAEVRASGPFDAAKSEGKLNVAILSLDRRVLNLAGAASGIDFGTTVVNSTNVVELAQGGAVITAVGQLDAARVAITRQQQTTPVLDFRCDYAVTVDNAAKSALLRKLNLTGMQNARPLLQTELTSPMTLSFGGTNAAAGDAALNVTLTGLNLADWRAFAADFAPAGAVNAQLKLLSQQGGQRLTFDVDGNVIGLAARFGSNAIAQADVKLTARGLGVDMKQFALSDFRVELAQAGEPALTVSGNGSFDSATKDADLQVALRATMAKLLGLFPQPDATFTGGAVELTGRVGQKAQQQTVAGRLAVSGLSGRHGNLRFASFGATADLDLGMKGDLLDIRKAAGELREGANSGGKFDVTGNFDTAKKAGKLALKLTDFNQAGLRPFLESALDDKTLVSVALSSTATVTLEANGDAAAKADLQMANLVVRDPKGSLPKTPLELKAQLDATVANQVAKIAQCQLTLTPTDRGRNELKLTGAVDYSKTNAITGSLRLMADSLDVTRYYDLFTGGPKTAAPETAPAAAPTDNTEPAAVKLPFRDFTFEASVQRFYLHEVEATNFQFVAKLDGSRVLLKPAQLFLNGAPVTATADLDLGVPGYKYDVSFTANGVPVEPLANTFSPTYRGQAQGRLIANGQLKGAGVTGLNLKKSLAGTVNFSFTNANIQIVGPKVKAVLTPIALVLGAPELLRSPLDFVNASLRAGNGQIEVPQFIAHSAAFRAYSAGAIPMADVLKDSRLNQDIEIELPRELANKLRFTNVPTNVTYMKLPTFVHLRGTLGAPDTKTDKLVIVGLTAAGIGGALGNKGGSILQGVGQLLGGALQPVAPATNPPATTTTNAPARPGTNAPTKFSTNAPAPPPATNAPPASPLNNLLDLLTKPKKQ